MEKILEFSLCEGRHTIPTKNGSIFENSITYVTDTERMERVAFTKLWNAAYSHYNNGESGWLHIPIDWDGSDMVPLKFCKGLRCNLYVTGLTVATVAVINVCREEGIDLTLYHYDRESGSYYPQKVVS